MDWTLAGLLLVAAGGVMQGSFALPHKFVRGWSWEKMWLFYSITGMIALPWMLTAVVIPDALGVYSGAGTSVVARTALFGLGWGLGSVLFGLGIAMLGMALGIAIIISVVAAAGSLVPLAVLHPEQLWTEKGALLIAGLGLVAIGMLFCARAGALRDARAQAGTNLGRGLVVCLASGILSSMLNFSFAFGEPIAAEAVRRGATPGNAPFAIFTVAVAAGFLANAGYCIYLLKRNASWKGTGAGGRNGALACAGGALWLFGFFFYALGIGRMGALGAPVGWPMFMMILVLTANVWSLATGERRKALRAALRNLGVGMAILLAALAVIAAGAAR